MGRIAKMWAWALLLGAAIFAVGTSLARDSTRALSLSDAETLAGGACWCCYTETGDCQEDCAGECEPWHDCSYWDNVDDCLPEYETDNQGHHEYYCDESISDHCQVSDRDYLCAFRYECGWYQGACIPHEDLKSNIELGDGCEHHPPREGY